MLEKFFKSFSVRASHNDEGDSPRSCEITQSDPEIRSRIRGLIFVKIHVLRPAHPLVLRLAQEPGQRRGAHARPLPGALDPPDLFMKSVEADAQSASGASKVKELLLKYGAELESLYKQNEAVGDTKKQAKSKVRSTASFRGRQIQSLTGGLGDSALEQKPHLAALYHSCSAYVHLKCGFDMRH